MAIRGASLGIRTKSDCANGKGYDGHKYRGEKPCDNCLRVYREKMAQYRELHKEKIKLQLKEWNKVNAEKASTLKKSWKIKNAEKVKANRLLEKHLRRARLAGVPFESYTVQDILNTHGTDCHICHTPIDLNAPRQTRYNGWERGLHLDHVIPISAGGSDLIENVKPSHGFCNLSKGKQVA